MSFRKHVTRPAFEVMFKVLRLIDCLESNVNFYLPRCILGCVLALSCVVGREPLTKIFRVTDITLSWMTETLNYVCVKHVMACHP